MLEIDKLSAHINNHVHGLSHGAYHLLRHAARLRRRRVKWVYILSRASDTSADLLFSVPQINLSYRSDGTNRPYRCSIRAPGFAHLAGSDFMMRRMFRFLLPDFTFAD